MPRPVSNACLSLISPPPLSHLPPVSPLQRLLPEKLSRCQWLPAVSEAVVKRPCVRLPLATVTTAAIVILSVFNLVSPRPRVERLIAWRRAAADFKARGPAVARPSELYLYLRSASSRRPCRNFPLLSKSRVSQTVPLSRDQTSSSTCL